MLCHLRGLRKTHASDEAFYKNLSDWCSEFWKFVCTRLLTVQTYEDVRMVATVLETVGKDFPRLLTTLGRVIVKLVQNMDCIKDLHDITEEPLSVSAVQ